MKKIALTVFILTILYSAVGWGQTSLSPGDIIMVTVNADGNDNFDFVPLVDLSSGTVINFTDNAWVTSNGAFNSNEGIIVYTSSSSISKGTVVSYPGSTGGEWTSGGGSFNCSGSGDNILVYQGSSLSPSFIYGIGWAISTPWAYSGTTNSDIPSALSSGANTIISLGTSDNYQYNTISGTSGTSSELLALIANSGNWNGNNTNAYTALSTTFTISDGGSPTPSITTSTTSLSSFLYESRNGPSASQSFAISGSDLTADITIVPSTNYEISDDDASFQSTNITLTQSGGSVSETIIYVRLKSGLSNADYSEDITISSTGASSKAVSCSGTVYTVISSNVIINEVDSDTPDTDTEEFIELYDGGFGNTVLDGLVVVLFNGNGDLSYAAYDLDGYSTNGDGYFVIGNSAVPNVDIVFSNNFLQNGADAVALYQADANDFPNNTAVTTYNLIDAVVYDTDDADDAGLLVLLNSSEPQINENGNDGMTNHSIQRIPDGTGGARNTSTYSATIPTPGTMNTYISAAWTGTTDNDWATDSNWDTGVPTAATDVTIPSGVSNYPTITTPAECHNLTIESDVTLLGTENLTINGTSTVKRSLTERTWQYLTPPTAGATANDIEIPQADGDAYILTYNNSAVGSGSDLSLGWNYLTHDTDALSAGTGYGIWVTSPKEINFSGSLITGDQTISGINIGDSGSNPWVFIGNSALAHLDWSAVASDDDISGTAYMYATNSYVSINSAGVVTNAGSKYIPPMQGFFVEATGSGDNSITFPTSALSHQSQSFYKSEPLLRNFLRLAVEKEGYFDETVIYFDNEASNDYTPKSDSHKLLITQEGIPQIYTLANDEKLVFNLLNSWPVTVPLIVSSSTAEQLIINAKEIANLDDNLSIILENPTTNTTYDLNKSPELTFDALPGENKFNLHFEIKTGVEINESLNTRIAVVGKTLSVLRESSTTGDLNIYNTSGQLIEKFKLASHNTVIETTLKQGIYIAKITDGKSIKTQKIAINY